MATVTAAMILLTMVQPAVVYAIVIHSNPGGMPFNTTVIPGELHSNIFRY